MMKYLPKKRIIQSETISFTRNVLKSLSLNTVCDSARCPNICECFSQKHATFLLMGDICTRGCRFCSVEKGQPLSVDESEIARIADAVKKLGLKYVVLTSVSRDDLDDGGAYFFARSADMIKKIDEDIFLEALVPDFKGSAQSIKTVVNSGIDVFAHNLETVKNLYPLVRPQADYASSLNVLKTAKNEKSVLTKSGIMLGLGERESQVKAAMNDLLEAGCDILVVGQYLCPGENCLEVEEYLSEERFENYKKLAYQLGFKHVISEPFARSSYKARESVNILAGGKDEGNILA